jgi:hypothetical protein
LRKGVLVGAFFAFVGAFSFDVRADAQARSDGAITHVICVTNETADALDLWIKQVPEAPGPDTGFGAIPGGTPYCYRRSAMPGRTSTIALTERLPGSESIRTADDIAALAERMTAMSQTAPSCEVSPGLLEQANVEQRRAILVRVYAEGGSPRCETSVGAAPEGAAGLEAFETTREGRPPTYYESAERQSFALCVASDRRLEVAAWPQARPQLPSDFFPKANVIRIGGGMPWCSRVWLRPGGDVVVSLGAINARELPSSPDFSEACVVSAELIAQARAGDRQGVLVSVSRRRGQRQCEASLISAPERAIGLNAFNPPPVELEAPA